MISRSREKLFDVSNKIIHNLVGRFELKSYQCSQLKPKTYTYTKWQKRVMRWFKIEEPEVFMPIYPTFKEEELKELREYIENEVVDKTLEFWNQDGLHINICEDGSVLHKDGNNWMGDASLEALLFHLFGQNPEYNKLKEKIMNKYKEHFNNGTK